MPMPRLSLTLRALLLVPLLAVGVDVVRATVVCGPRAESCLEAAGRGWLGPAALVLLALYAAALAVGVARLARGGPVAARRPRGSFARLWLVGSAGVAAACAGQALLADDARRLGRARRRMGRRRPALPRRGRADRARAPRGPGRRRRPARAAARPRRASGSSLRSASPAAWRRPCAPSRRSRSPRPAALLRSAADQPGSAAPAGAPSAGRDRPRPPPAPRRIRPPSGIGRRRPAHASVPGRPDAPARPVPTSTAQEPLSAMSAPAHPHPVPARRRLARARRRRPARRRRRGRRRRPLVLRRLRSASAARRRRAGRRRPRGRRAVRRPARARRRPRRPRRAAHHHGVRRPPVPGVRRGLRDDAAHARARLRAHRQGPPRRSARSTSSARTPTARRASRPAPSSQGRLFPFLHVFYANQGAENSGYATDAFLRGVARAAGVDGDAALARPAARSRRSGSTAPTPRPPGSASPARRRSPWRATAAPPAGST